MKTGICLQARNEAPYLAEWASYHLALGFDRIWVYDNDSEDKIEEALRPYRDRVELISWPGVPAFPGSVIDCLQRAEAEGIDWLALFDADEFVVPANGDPGTLREALQSAGRDGIEEIGLPIHFYASEGHVLIPPGRVVDNYRTVTRRENHKAIVRVGSRPHPVTTHRFSSRRFRKVDGLRLQHYRNKSKEDEMIRRMKGFVDDWGRKHFTAEAVFDDEWARHEPREGLAQPDDGTASRLSAQFGTAVTQPELGIDPVKVVIFERNQPNGPRLKEQLSPVFRDVVLWDVGSDVRSGLADACFPNDGFSVQLNRAHEAARNANVLWLLHADIFLHEESVRYKEAIVSSYPFGIWSPQLCGKHRKDQIVPEGRLCSVRFVESVAWAVSRQARKLGFPLPDGSPIGWGQDLILSRKCLDSGLRNLIDARVSVSHIHESEYVSYDRVEAERQMNMLLAREFPDGRTFGAPGQPRRVRNLLGFA